MFGIGETEFLIIVVFGFLLFGPDKLPGAGRTIGRAIKQFRQAEEGFTKVVQAEIVDPIQAAAQAPAEKMASAVNEATSDEDLPEQTTAPEAPKESFAERKARMEAERKEKAEQAGTEQAEPAADPASDDDLPEEDVQAAADKAAEEEAAAKRRSVASLYGLDADADAPAADDADADADADIPAETGEEGSAEL